MLWTGTSTLLGSALALVVLASLAAAEDRAAVPIRLAQAPHDMVPQTPMPTAAEARMNMRFPQPVRVGDLIGLPVLDDDDTTLGRVREVVRDPKGKIKLIVGYSKWWGLGGRPVAVPIEVVVILARQIDSVDMKPAEYASAPTWMAGTDQPIAPDQIIRIGVGRR
jgi:sporulation protein YlmC with PRC-barrel domain